MIQYSADVHTGIAVSDHAQTFIYTYQADKYFTPASNIKIISLLPGLKYLGDSLPALTIPKAANTCISNRVW